MSEHEHSGSQLWRELHDLQGRYELAKGELSAEDMLPSSRRCGALQSK